MDEDERRQITDLGDCLGVRQEVVGMRVVDLEPDYGAERGGLPPSEDRTVFGYSWEHSRVVRDEAERELKRMRESSFDPEVKDAAALELSRYDSVRGNIKPSSSDRAGRLISFMGLALTATYLLVNDGCAGW